MVRSYLNPRLVRPTGQNAITQAERLGPADATVLRSAAATLDKAEELVFSAVNAHRLRILADTFEKGETNAPKAEDYLPPPGALAEALETIQRRIDAAAGMPAVPCRACDCTPAQSRALGVPESAIKSCIIDYGAAEAVPAGPVTFTTDEAITLVQTLKQFDESLGLSMANVEAWKKTAEGIQNVLNDERERAAKYRGEVEAQLRSLARDAEKAEKAAPGIKQKIVFALVEGDDLDAMGVEAATELALALIQKEGR